MEKGKEGEKKFSVERKHAFLKRGGTFFEGSEFVFGLNFCELRGYIFHLHEWSLNESLDVNF